MHRVSGKYVECSGFARVRQESCKHASCSRRFKSGGRASVFELARCSGEDSAARFLSVVCFFVFENSDERLKACACSIHFPETLCTVFPRCPLEAPAEAIFKTTRIKPQRWSTIVVAQNFTDVRRSVSTPRESQPNSKKKKETNNVEKFSRGILAKTVHQFEDGHTTQGHR